MTRRIYKDKRISDPPFKFTHDKEQLCNGQKLSLEQPIDRVLDQAPHLPPVREQREARQHEADDVDQKEEDDEQIEIQQDQRDL